MEATRGVPGLSQRHARQVAFMMRQMTDILAPTNIPWVNPAIAQRTLADGGANLVRGVGELAGRHGARAVRAHRRQAPRPSAPARRSRSRPAAWCSATT